MPQLQTAVPDPALLPPDVKETMRLVVTLLLQHFRETQARRVAAAGGQEARCGC